MLIFVAMEDEKDRLLEALNGLGYTASATQSRHSPGWIVEWHGGYVNGKFFPSSFDS